MKTICVIMFCLSQWILCFGGTNYYFSTSGNDTNTGIAQDSPWKSFTKVISGPFIAGDSILLKAGDVFGNLVGTDQYRNRLNLFRDGTSSAPITIGRYGTGANPILLGDNTEAVWSLEPGRSNIYSSPLSGILGVADTNGVLYGQMPTFDDFVGTQDQWLDTFTNSSWGKLTAGGTVVYLRTSDDSNPDTGKIRAAHRAVEIDGSYITVENLDVRRAYQGISANFSTNIVVRNCNVEDTWGTGLRFYYVVSGEMASNTVTRAGWTAVYLGDLCLSNRVHHNVISFSTNIILGISEPYSDASELGGIGMKQGAHNIVEHNEVSEVEGFVDTYYEQGSTIRFNYFNRSRSGSGVAPTGTGWRIHHNIFNFGPAGQKALGGFWDYDSGLSFGTNDLGPNLIYNNVFYGFRDYGFYSPTNGQAGVVLRNNIFVSANVSGSDLARTHSGPDSDYNMFFSLGPTNFYYQVQEVGHSLALYQSASGMESNSAFGDPQFVSDNPATAADFKLKPTSPCINAGSNLKTEGLLGFGADYLDYSGAMIPRGAGSDIGAFEFVNSYGTAISATVGRISVQ